MKKYFLLYVLAILSAASCKKSMGDCNTTTNKISVDNAVVIKQGAFVFTAGKTNNGVAKIYQQKDGKFVLGVEDMNFSSSRDFEVYFSPSSSAAGAVKLFSAKSINTKTYYQLPDSINDSFSFVVIQNDILPEPIAVAQLE